MRKRFLVIAAGVALAVGALGGPQAVACDGSSHDRTAPENVAGGHWHNPATGGHYYVTADGDNAHAGVSNSDGTTYAEVKGDESDEYLVVHGKTGSTGAKAGYQGGGPVAGPCA